MIFDLVACWVYRCSLLDSLVCFYFGSELTSKLEELQDKNISQKELLRDMTAKIEVKRVQLLNFYSVSLSEWNIEVFIDKLYM